jgi:hypothetical protein
MFKRPHHQRILKLLHSLDGRLLEEAGCFFGGGTAIVLLLEEYRESVDMDLMCASADGYRILRNVAYDDGLSGFFKMAPRQLRDLRSDRYGIRTFVEVDGIPVKFEIVREDRISLAGAINPTWGIPVLCQMDMFAEKLLANADRYADVSYSSRDMIDLAMMMSAWGAIPKTAWDKVEKAYGPSARKAFFRATEMLMDSGYLSTCLKKLQMDDCLIGRIPTILKNAG